MPPERRAERRPAPTELDPAPRRLRQLAQAATRGVARLVRGVAFWVGVALPFAYLPLIVGGLARVELAAFVAIVTVHSLALVLGAGYRPPGPAHD